MRAMSNARAKAEAVAAIVALAAAAWLIAGRGLINYDTLYSLVWGRELSEGHSLYLGAPFTPTLHPFGTLLGILFAPFSKTVVAGVHGVAATDIVAVLAFLALGAMLWLTYALFQHLATGYQRNEHSGQSAMNLPVWPFRLVFLIAFTLFALQILAEIVKTVRGFNAAAARGDTA